MLKCVIKILSRWQRRWEVNFTWTRWVVRNLWQEPLQSTESILVWLWIVITTCPFGNIVIHHPPGLLCWICWGWTVRSSSLQSPTFMVIIIWTIWRLHFHLPAVVEVTAWYHHCISLLLLLTFQTTPSGNDSGETVGKVALWWWWWCRRLPREPVKWWDCESWIEDEFRPNDNIISW